MGCKMKVEIEYYGGPKDGETSIFPHDLRDGRIVSSLGLDPDNLQPIVKSFYEFTEDYSKHTGFRLMRFREYK